jgi:hypothetical protein
MISQYVEISVAEVLTFAHDEGCEKELLEVCESRVVVFNNAKTQTANHLQKMYLTAIPPSHLNNEIIVSNSEMRTLKKPGNAKKSFM